MREGIAGFAGEEALIVSRAEISSARRVARLVRRSLEEGSVVEIERLGLFRPTENGGYEFLPNTAPKVFVAYVEEDIEAAQRIYSALRKAGFDPWLDRRSLLPGQNWLRAIERAIEVSDFVVACLSPQSVCKRGIFQNEMRWAMDVARRLPLDDLFFVPVRLAACSVPRRIQAQWQYIDLFPRFDPGRRKLVSAIRREWLRRNRR